MFRPLEKDVSLLVAEPLYHRILPVRRFGAVNAPPREKRRKLRDRDSEKLVLVDVVYDHFLATNWHQHHDMPLPEFATYAYSIMENNLRFIPEKTAFMLSHMARQNWLLSYAEIAGIERALQGMSKRTLHPTQLYLAIEELTEQYEEIKTEWQGFFSEAKLKFPEFKKKAE